MRIREILSIFSSSDARSKELISDLCKKMKEQPSSKLDILESPAKKEGNYVGAYDNTNMSDGETTADSSRCKLLICFLD